MSNQFGQLEEDLSHFTRAIGHPARVAVLICLAKMNKEIEGEIISVPPLSQATVIQHLRELKRAGLVQGRIFGAKSKYGIDKENFSKFIASFQEFEKLILNDSENLDEA